MAGPVPIPLVKAGELLPTATPVKLRILGVPGVANA